MDAPKKIHVRWGKSGDTRVTYMEERFWPPDNEAEYILAAEYDRLMAEKDAKIERLRTAPRRIDSDIGISILHHDDGLWETAYYRLKEVARAAIRGNNG